MVESDERSATSSTSYRQRQTSSSNTSSCIMDRPSLNGSPIPSTSTGGQGGSQQTGLFISAPGKIILFGEHAVVYGRVRVIQPCCALFHLQTAVAGSIDLRTYVSMFTSQDGVIYLSLPDLNVEKTWLLKELHKAVDRLSGKWHKQLEGTTLQNHQTAYLLTRVNHRHWNSSFLMRARCPGHVKKRVASNT